MTAIGLRPTTPADEEYCFQLHKAAMGAYITAIWGWDEGIQRAFHTGAFTPGRWQIVHADGNDVGMLHAERRPTELYLARIELHPHHQGRSIGSRLIRALLQQAREESWEFTLDVPPRHQPPSAGPLPAHGPARSRPTRREQHQNQDVQQAAST
jgi:GNAT superfamily N-acetyltransferase